MRLQSDFLTTKNKLIMDKLQFLNIEYPQSRNRIDDKCNLTWNELSTLLNKYEEHKQVKNNVAKSNVKSTSICECCKTKEATLCPECVADAIELVV